MGRGVIPRIFYGKPGSVADREVKWISFDTDLNWGLRIATDDAAFRKFVEDHNRMASIRIVDPAFTDPVFDGDMTIFPWPEGTEVVTTSPPDTSTISPPRNVAAG